MASNLEDMLSAVKAGEIDFNEFVSSTRREFRAMAAHLMRRWSSPEWFTPDDLEQELYLGAWDYVWRFEPLYGTTLVRFVVYNAMSQAKRELHLARGVTISGSPDRKKSQFETPLSFFGPNGEGEALMESILGEPTQWDSLTDEALIADQERRRAIMAALTACETTEERFAVLAIREAGFLDGAGQVLYDDIDHRITLRLASEEHADRFVRRQAMAVAQRLSCQVDLTHFDS